MAGRLAAVGVFAAVATVGIAAALLLDKSDNRASSQPPLTPQERSTAPKHLQENLAQANQLVDGSIQDRIEGLRGLPVVVNQWASWCPNCRSEFPFFQRIASELRTRVAFLGLDSQDGRGDAESFLKRYPVPYPSVYDPEASQAISLGGGQGWPTTIIFNRRGEVTHIRPGGYATVGQLREDVQHYALGSRG